MKPRTFRVGDRLPVSITGEELAQLIGVGLRRFRELRAAGTHPAIKPLDGPGRNPMYSGAVAQAWLDGRSPTQERDRLLHAVGGRR